MSETKSNILVNLVKKSVGLPTGSGSCCGAQPAQPATGCSCGAEPKPEAKADGEAQ